MQLHFSAPLLLPLLVWSGAAKDRVSEREGRVVVEDSSGHVTELTQTGLDSEPWLSPDGQTVVFLRQAGQAAEDMFNTSVFKIDMRTRTTKLLYRGPAKYQGRESSYFGRPELDESQSTLFLLSNEYATEGALIAIRLADGQVRLISDHVAGYDVVECPKVRGDLIALKRHLDVFDRPYFLYWLYSPSGKELGLAGGGELEPEMDELREGDCEEQQHGQASPPVPSRVKPPPEDKAVRVDGSAMEQRLLAQIEPTYPSEAQAEHIQGDVRFQVRVGADGTVQEANVISGPPQLVAAAKAAVRQWRYRPIMVLGKPVAVLTSVTVRFRLPDE